MPHQAADFIFEWQHGRPVRDHAGREVVRAILHFDGGLQVTLRYACDIMDEIVNAPFLMFAISRISLIVLDLEKRSVEVVPIEDFVVWPPVHLVATA